MIRTHFSKYRVVIAAVTVILSLPAFASAQTTPHFRTCKHCFPGIDVPRNGKEVYTLRYVDFIMPIIKGMQEQQKLIDSQKKEMDKLKETVSKLAEQQMILLQKAEK